MQQGWRARRATSLALIGIAAGLAACAGAADRKAAIPAGEPSVPLYSDLGSHSHPITTRSPLAQQYFDQGLRLVFGFNHDEARRAFEQTARLDPDAAMAYWGIAYTLGPNYNMPADPERDREAWQAVLRAQAAASGVSDAERAYIAAIATRYSADAPVDRRALDEAYANAMRALAQAHPDDLDAATLYAESLMDLRPWNLWTHAGEPQPGTPEIVATLESVLARNPEHPGANHYYIHAVEASNEPARALPSADRLGGISPGAGHLVHMPSHIYIRTGRYADATDTNVRAVAVDEKYIREQNVQGAYAMMYYPHNVDFIYASAAFDGRSATAIEAADKLAGTIHFAMIPEMPMLEGFVPRPLFARLRFGKWQEILAQPAPPSELPYATGVWHYARGIAFLRTGKLREARAELAALEAILRAQPPARLATQVNTSVQLLGIASHTLAGEIAAKQGRYREATRQLEAAVVLQDALTYMEPPDWYFPVRQSLGQVLLDAGQPAQAEAVYRRDLVTYPDNGWSLYGLAASLRAQRKTEQAAEAQARFTKAWQRADVALSASRY
jgi:tetratricopeptide (TPR) repeat protein